MLIVVAMLDMFIVVHCFLLIVVAMLYMFTLFSWIASTRYVKSDASEGTRLARCERRHAARQMRAKRRIPAILAMIAGSQIARPMTYDL